MLETFATMAMIKNKIEEVIRSDYEYDDVTIGSAGNEEKATFKIKIYLDECLEDVRKEMILALKKVYSESKPDIEWGKNTLVVKQAAISYRDPERLLILLNKIRLAKHAKKFMFFNISYDLPGLFDGLGKSARGYLLSSKNVFGTSIIDMLVNTKDRELISSVLLDLNVSDIRHIFDKAHPFYSYRLEPRRLFNIMSLLLLSISTTPVLFLGITVLSMALVFGVVASAGVTYLSGFAYQSLRSKREKDFIVKCLPYLEDKDDDDLPFLTRDRYLHNSTYRSKLTKEKTNNLAIAASIIIPPTHADNIALVNIDAGNTVETCDKPLSEQEKISDCAASNNHDTCDANRTALSCN